MQELLTHLATNGGSVGVALGLAYLYIRQQHKELREVENKRVEDNKAMVTKLLELNDKWNETINAQIEVSEAQKTLLADLKLQMDQRHSRR
jgi:hypothetical protein